jgi:hypothetical protein
VTLAGTAVATLAPTDTTSHDRPRAAEVFVNPIPPRVIVPTTGE